MQQTTFAVYFTSRNAVLAFTAAFRRYHFYSSVYTESSAVVFSLGGRARARVCECVFMYMYPYVVLINLCSYS
jgi:hypothetical protein